jgi:hypothetical protein
MNPAINFSWFGEPTLSRAVTNVYPGKGGGRTYQSLFGCRQDQGGRAIKELAGTVKWFPPLTALIAATPEELIMEVLTKFRPTMKA